MESEKKVTPLEEYVSSDIGSFSDVGFEDTKIPVGQFWKDVDALEFPEDRWLVPNLLPKEGMTMLASISGVGKSIYAMHWATCIAEGKPFFGNEKFKTSQRRVLYINLEMSLSEIQRRGRMMGLDIENKNLIFLNEDDFNLNEGMGQQDLKYKWLLRFIYEKEIQVVIIDTFRATSGGLKEDKAEDVRKFFMKFQILKNSGVSLIFLEHLRKPSQLEGKVPKKEQVLGSQDKVANLEILLMIHKDEVTGQHHIYQRKNRMGDEIKPFAVKVSDVVDSAGMKRMEFEYIGEVEDDMNKKEEAKNLIMQILSSGETKNRKELGELTKKQVGDKNIRAALRELRELGEIDYVKDGKRHMYFIPKGKDTEEEAVLNQKDMDF